MGVQHGENRRGWKPDPRLAAVFRRAIDLIFPPHALDGRGSPQTPGLSSETWSRVRFISEPAVMAAGNPSL
jgi:hypothetical protein